MILIRKICDFPWSPGPLSPPAPPRARRAAARARATGGGGGCDRPRARAYAYARKIGIFSILPDFVSKSPVVAGFKPLKSGFSGF